MPFALAHWILAAKYRMNAAEMPLIIQGQQIPKEQRAQRLRTFKVLFALNILSPLAEMCVYIALN